MKSNFSSVEGMSFGKFVDEVIIPMVTEVSASGSFVYEQHHKDLVQALSDNRSLVSYMDRQMGSSTIARWYALWLMLHYPASRVAVLTPNSQAWFHHMLALVNEYAKRSESSFETRDNSRMMISAANGSTLMSGCAGGNADYAILDGCGYGNCQLYYADARKLIAGSRTEGGIVMLDTGAGKDDVDDYVDVVQKMKESGAATFYRRYTDSPTLKLHVEKNKLEDTHDFKVGGIFVYVFHAK